MKIFMVERDMSGASLDDLGQAKHAANYQAELMREQGVPIRYVRTTFVPEDGRCMCLFEAENSDDVRKLNDDAELPYFQVIAAYDLTP